VLSTFMNQETLYYINLVSMETMYTPHILTQGHTTSTNLEILCYSHLITHLVHFLILGS
jgi:hypothetical protein